MTLSFSKNIDLQRRAALALCSRPSEMVPFEAPLPPVGCELLDSILHLLNSHDTGIQKSASDALQYLVYKCA